MMDMTDEVSPAWEIQISRKFKAPRALVFAAWTDAAHLIKWSGPEGFTCKHDTFDCTSGGHYRSCLLAPDGTEHWLRGQYLEVEAPSRLAFTHAWEDVNGTAGPATRVTISFTESDGGTLMHFHQASFTSLANRDGHVTGWTSSFAELDRFLVAQIVVPS
jgi:uncharacterized protein YndB with AHSA1/START domain